MACGDADEARAPSWSTIAPLIIQPNCATASCHSQGAAVAGLNLSTNHDGYTSLLALSLPVRGKAKVQPRPMVVPYAPDHSRIMHMLNGDRTERMPPDRPLAVADIRLIEAWILRGAPND